MQSFSNLDGDADQSRKSSASSVRRGSRLSSSAGIFDLEEVVEPEHSSRDRFSSHGSSQHGSVSSRSSRNLFDVQEEEVISRPDQPRPFFASPLFTDPFSKSHRSSPTGKTSSSIESLDPKSPPGSTAGQSSSSPTSSARSVTSHNSAFTASDLAQSLRHPSDASSDQPPSPVHVTVQQPPTTSQQLSTTHASPIPVATGVDVAFSPPISSQKPISRNNFVRKMSFDTAPSFSSPLAFASTLSADDDNDDSAGQARQVDTSTTPTGLPSGSAVHSMNRASSSSDVFANDSEDAKRSGIDRRSSLRRDPSNLSAIPAIKPVSRFDRERSGTNSLHRAATGATRINLTPARQGTSTGGSTSALDDEASSVASDDFTAGSNLTRKSSVTSTTGSMGPPAVPRRGAGSNSPVIEPVDKPMSTIAMGKVKEDTSLGMGLPSYIPSASSAHALSSSSSGSGSPVPRWDSRETRSRSGSGATMGMSPPIGGSAVLSSNRRRRLTSSSLSSSAHRRARSLGGVLLGEGTASPIGGPDGVDPNLVAAIEARSPTLPVPVPIPLSSLSRRSGSMSSSGTMGASSLSNSSFGPSSVPSTPFNASRMSQKGRRYSQVIEDDDETAQTSESAVAIPNRRSRVRSQTLLSSGGSPGNEFSGSLGSGSSGRGSSSAGLADAIRLQKVPAAVRMAGDLFPTSAPSSRNLLKSQSARSMDTAGITWDPHTAGTSYQASSSISATSEEDLGDDNHSLGLGLGFAADHNQYGDDKSSRLNVPLTPNATRSNSPLASEYSYSTGVGTSGSSSPAHIRSRNQRTSSPGTDAQGQPLALSIPIGRNFGSPASLPGSAVPSSRASGLPDYESRGVRSSLSRQSGLPASTSAYSALLSLGSSVQTRPVSERRVQLSPSNLGPQRFSWDAQDLFDSLSTAGNGKDTAVDKPAPWIESSQDTPSRASAAQVPFDKRRSALLSSSIGAESVLNVPDVPVRHHRPSDAGASSSSRADLGTDEYARIILQSRNAKMQKWRAQGGRGPSSEARRKPSGLEDDHDKSGYLKSTSSTRKSTLGRRGTTAGLVNTPSGLLDAPIPRRRESIADSNDSIESQLGEDEASQRGHEKAFAEFEWVDWLDEYRKMKEAKLRAENLIEDEDDTEMETASHSKQSPRGRDTIGDADRRVGSEAADSSRALATQGQKDGSRSVSDPLSRQRLQLTEEEQKAQDEADAKEVEDALAALDLGNESETTISHSHARTVPQVSGVIRRPDASVSQHTRPAIDTLRGHSYTSPERSVSTFSALSPQVGFSPVKKLGSERTKNSSLSPVTTRATPSAGYTSVGVAPYTQIPRGRRKHLGGKIEAWWSAVKTGFSAPPGDTWSRVPQSNMTPSSSLSPSVSRDPMSSLARTLQHGTEGRAKMSPASAIPQQVAAKSSPAASSDYASSPLVTQVQSGFGVVAPSPKALQEGDTSKIDAERANSSPSLANDSPFVAKESAVKRRQQPNLSLQFGKGISSFDAKDFDSTNVSTPGSASKSQEKGSPSMQATLTADAAAQRKLSDSGPKRPVYESRWSSGRGSGGDSDVGTKLAATSKDVTINSIRQHIRHRLLGSKESCDRELRRIINAINAFVELDLERQKEERKHSVVDDHDVEELEVGTVPAPLLARSYVMSRSASGTSSHSEAESPGVNPDAGTASVFAASSADASRNSSTSQLSREYKLSAPPPVTHAAPVAIAVRAVSAGSASYPIKSSNLNPMGRGASINRASRSVSVSRSTSRSHSPMPGAMLATNSSSASNSPRLSPSRRPKVFSEEHSQQPWITALEKLVTAAMEVLDVSISSLIAHSGLCSELIASIQAAGRMWDEHTEWPGRGWFIEILLAVAGLSRVVEWWEAEKGFWNFNDEDEQDIEPIRFIVGNQQTEALHEAFDFRPSALKSNSPTRARAFSIQEVTFPPRVPTSGSNSPALSAIRSGSDIPRDLSPRPSMALISRNADADTDYGDQTVVEADRSPLMDEDDDDDQDDHDEAPEIVAKEDEEVERPLQGVKSAGVNVLMELSLDDQHLLYLSPAWKTVVGSNIDDLYDTPIEELLAPGDADVFAEASRQLEVNQSHTVEAAFRLRVEKATLGEVDTSDPDLTTASESDPEVVYYQEMEGKGMLMLDRQSGEPSHSMWVFKATGPAEPEDRLPEKVLPKASRSVGTFLDNSGVAHAASISVAPVLCRICERDVPTWFFEKHSEICNETHRLDMEIGECNENLREMRKSVQDLYNRLEDLSLAVPAEAALEYRGVAITTPPASSNPPSALEGLNRSISPRQPNAAMLRKTHLRAIDAAIEVLQVACEISTPAITDEHADEPIEKQRLLSPTSENKIVTVQQWRRTQLDDAALDMLMVDVENAMRSKLSAINRMLNTIVYVETVRQEWEERVEAALAALSGSDDEESLSNSGSVFSGSESGHEEPKRMESQSTQPIEDEIRPVQPIESQTSALLPHVYKGPDLGRAVLNSGAENIDADVDDVLSGDMLMERDDHEVLASHTEAFNSHATAGADVEDVPALDEENLGGGSAVLAPIPIPRGSSSLAPPSHLGLGLGLKESANAPQTMAASAPQRRSVSRSRRASRLPHMNENLLGTPPLSPHLLATSESLGAASRHHRRASVSLRSPMIGSVPLSPRLPPVAPSSKPTASSIKDFDFLKPISKGAFGSVYLAKKRTTGDYYAIKVLKKSDMIAKNQITNVKAERMILMLQNQSPFVVKLYFTFQNAGYLFLVMEYLPGGDCATLGKVMGALPEEWARQYVAEVVIGLELLHSKGVVHRDLKPDNLLIDQKGHLKLTDFGLSKIGLLGRQTRQTGASAMDRSSVYRGSSATDSNQGSVPTSAASFGSHPRQNSSPSGTTAGDTAASFSPVTPSSTTPGLAGMMRNQSFYIAPPQGRATSSFADASDHGDAHQHGKALPEPMPSARIDSPGNFFGTHPLLNENFSQAGSESGAAARKFVGTPDYLAPESILGIGMDDFAVDWWALGVILYEFIYGIPPFHAETPEKVFDNILSRRIDWQEDSVEVSPEARHLMESLMCTDPKRRLGSQGVNEIKAHPFFADFDWENVTAEPGPFVPQVSDPESTDYFDLRGASQQDFEEEPVHITHDFAKAIEGNKFLKTTKVPARMRSQLDKIHAVQAAASANEEFGNFSYKNLPVLKQANDEVIRKMREEQMPALTKAMEQTSIHSRHRSFSGKARPTQRVHSQPVGPPSPAYSMSSQGSTPSRSTAPASPAGLLQNTSHRRRTSEQATATSPIQRIGASGSGTSSSGGGNDTVTSQTPATGSALPIGIANRMRQQLSETGDGDRRNSMPSRLRTKSAGFSDKPFIPPQWQQEGGRRASRAVDGGVVGSPVANISPSASSATGLTTDSAGTGPSAITCLVAEDNPIALRMLETILTKLGCHCTTVRNGAEAVRLAMGDTKYGVLFVDVTLPIVNGQDVARMVKSTRNANSATPIVALAAYDRGDPVDVSGSVFDAVLAKPLEKMDVCATLSRLGFTPTQAGSANDAAKAADTSGTTLAVDSRPLSRKTTISRPAPGKMVTPPIGDAAKPITPYSSSPLSSSVLTSRFLESQAKRDAALQDEQDMATINTLTRAAEKLSLS